DDEVVLARLAQVERLDRDPLHREADGVPVEVERQVQALHQLFVTERPVDIRAQRETDRPGHFSHGYSYTSHRGAGTGQGTPPRRRSRQFSQLCPSRAST